MDALRVWTERAAKRETSGDDALWVSSAALQHRTAGRIGNRGGIVASCRCLILIQSFGLTTGSSVWLKFTSWSMRA